MGVDVVELSRVARILGDYDERFVAALLTRREAMWVRHWDPIRGAAACLAVKESLVKALGGRPRYFSWREIEVRTPTVLPAASRSFARLARSLMAAVPLGVMAYAICGLSGGAREQAHRRLEGREGMRIVAEAAWGWTSGYLYAVAAISSADHDG